LQLTRKILILWGKWIETTSNLNFN
jgi:hypothetical protein